MIRVGARCDQDHTETSSISGGRPRESVVVGEPADIAIRSINQGNQLSAVGKFVGISDPILAGEKHRGTPWMAVEESGAVSGDENPSTNRDNACR